MRYALPRLGELAGNVTRLASASPGHVPEGFCFVCVCLKLCGKRWRASAGTTVSTAYSKDKQSSLFLARCPKCAGDEGCSVARVVDGDVEEPLSNHRHDLRG